jgi:hypothetical protein
MICPPVIFKWTNGGQHSFLGVLGFEKIKFDEVVLTPSMETLLKECRCSML